MPGNVKRMIDSIVEQRSKGNPTLVASTRTKLILKGLNPDRFTDASPDDAALINKVRAIAAELGVDV
jgi:hypothetical protein